MTRLVISIVIVALVLALCRIEAKLMLHRTEVPDNFVKLSLADAKQSHEFRIAFKQRNIDILEKKILEVSNPESASYGKWWTTEQILDLIAPLTEEIIPVISWLKAHGVAQIDISGRDFVKVVATVGTIQELFHTQMYNFRSEHTGKIYTRAYGEVHIPNHLDIIDMVLGLTELLPPSVLHWRATDASKRNTEQTSMGGVYPGLLRDNYNMPFNYMVDAKSSFGVVQFQDLASFSSDDFEPFNSNMNESIHVDEIVGPFFGNSPDPQSNLQVQYGSALALNTTFWFWTVDRWLYEFATDFFNAKSFPLVVSMGWGWPEDLQCQIIGCKKVADSYAYVDKINVEFMKIGLKGVTLLASSGDKGAPGQKNFMCKKQIVSTMFPGSSPWVVSVGATMLSDQGKRSTNQVAQPPVCQQVVCATTNTEIPCSFPDAFITSGGGFSEVSPMPGWQKSAVLSYLNSTGITFPNKFNASNRGYPDISATGHSIIVQVGSLGGFIEIDGTAASVTIAGAVVSLMNSFMFDNGKNSLGFANPLLYQTASAFTDMSGVNNYCTQSCCSNVGYTAVAGWDAVSGLGTPIYGPVTQAIKRILKF